MKTVAKKAMSSGVALGLLIGCLLIVPLYFGCEALNYPTSKDINALTVADHEYVAGLQQATNDLMTEQHSAMTPELAEAFAVMQEQYNDLSAKLAAKAAETKAQGASIGSINGVLGGGLVPSLLSMFGLGSLIPIYNMFFGKSRAQAELDKMKLSLATRADAKDDGL